MVPSSSNVTGKSPSRRSNMCLTEIVIVATCQYRPCLSAKVALWPAPPIKPVGFAEKGFDGA
jgi:hypothetical protein